MLALAARSVNRDRIAPLEVSTLPWGAAKVRSRGGEIRMAVAGRSTELQSLLRENAALVSSLASVAPDMSEIGRLRFALQFSDRAEAETALRECVAWRTGEGRRIVEAAAG